jgi:predicted GIY-YIG superfamily endonuclease
MKDFIIYGLHFPDRPICYVGVTNNLDRRLKEHRSRLGRGVSAEVLETGYGTRIERAVAEHRWIEHFRQAGHKLYNLTEGGDGAETLSAEVRAKISERHKGKVVSEETRRKMSVAQKGKKKNWTAEGAERAKQTRIKPGTVPWNKFTPGMTDEEKAQIRQRICASQTSESRAKMSEASVKWNAEKWSNLTPEEWYERGRKISQGIRKSGKLKAANAARGEEVSTQMKSWWESLSPEARRDFVAKRNARRHPKYYTEK